MKLWPGWLVVMAAACAGGTHASSTTTTVNPLGTAAGADTPNATIMRVVDGDTVDVDIAGRKERVRLIGINTPETKKPNTPIECYGPEASAFTKKTLPEGTPVRIVRDVVGRDDYGRLLGYVYRSSDGLFVNLELAVEGYARPLTIPPNDTFATDFVRAALAAEASNVGLWSSCSG